MSDAGVATRPQLHLVLRLAYGAFTVYLLAVTAALLSPRVFDVVIGLVGLSWPAGGPARELNLLANIGLCGLVPTAYLAGRTALLGEWTRVNRAFFLCMLIANLAINAWSVATESAMAGVIAGDTALVVGLLVPTILARPTAPGTTPPAGS